MARPQHGPAAAWRDRSAARPQHHPAAAPAAPGG